MSDFEIKGGQCTVTDEAIVLNYSTIGLLKQIYGITPNTVRVVVLVVVAVLYLAVFERNPFAVGAIVIAVVSLGVYMTYNFIRDYIRDFTYDRRIPLEAIDVVTPIEGTRGKTVHRFTVRYVEEGTEKNRHIYMPSMYGSGDEEFRRAKEIFRSEGIPLEED